MAHAVLGRWAVVWGTCVCPHSPFSAGAGTSAGTLSGAPPAVPTWLLPSITTSGTSQTGASTPVEASAGATVAQPPGAGAMSLAAAVLMQSRSLATQMVAVGLATPQPAAKDTPTLVLPISGLLGIPGPLVARIREGKFIDLGDLLPEALEWAFDRMCEEKKEEGKKKKFPLSSITDWTLSFATYMAVTVHFVPQRAAPLATYMAIVARLAREVPGECWLRYDRMFRQAAAVNPALPWDCRELNVWLTAIVERSAPTGGGSVVTPRAQPIRALSQHAPAPGAKVCWRHQSGSCFGTCKFVHACVQCLSPNHVVKDCPKRPAP